MGASQPSHRGRFGHTLLELGGNNAMIITRRPTGPGPAGHRLLGRRHGRQLTTLRRLIAHRAVHDQLVESLTKAYASVPIGDPLEEGTLMGPLIDGAAHARMEDALTAAQEQGGTVHGGGRALAERWPDAYYVNPALAEMQPRPRSCGRRSPRPLRHAYDELEEAIAIQNGAAGAVLEHLHDRRAGGRDVRVRRRQRLRHRQRQRRSERRRDRRAFGGEGHGRRRRPAPTRGRPTCAARR